MNNCFIKSLFNPVSLGLYFGVIVLGIGHLTDFMPPYSQLQVLVEVSMIVIAVYFAYESYQYDCKKDDYSYDGMTKEKTERFIQLIERWSVLRDMDKLVKVTIPKENSKKITLFVEKYKKFYWVLLVPSVVLFYMISEKIIPHYFELPVMFSLFVAVIVMVYEPQSVRIMSLERKYSKFGLPLDIASYANFARSVNSNNSHWLMQTTQLNIELFALWLDNELSLVESELNELHPQPHWSGHPKLI